MKEIISRTNVIPEEIKRIKFKLFKLTSILVLRPFGVVLRDNQTRLNKDKHYTHAGIQER